MLIIELKEQDFRIDIPAGIYVGFEVYDEELDMESMKLVDLGGDSIYGLVPRDYMLRNSEQWVIIQEIL